LPQYRVLRPIYVILETILSNIMLRSIPNRLKRSSPISQRISFTNFQFSGIFLNSQLGASCSFAPELTRRPYRDSQVGNSFPFPPLKGGLSPFVRRSSRQRLLPLHRGPRTPMSFKDNGVRQKSGNSTPFFLANDRKIL